MSRVFRNLESKFATARWPDAGKPLKNNDRIFQEQDDVFQTGYRWEHYSTPIFTQYEDALVMHRGALDSITSKGRLHNAEMHVWETKDYAGFRRASEEYIWPDCDVLLYGDKVYRVRYEGVRCPDTNRVLRMKSYYTEELPVMKAKYPRPLPKSRNTILKPKAGDAFEYQGRKYIWIEDDGLKAVPYLGDNECYPTFIHVKRGASPSEVLLHLTDDPVSQFHHIALTDEMKPIERFTHDHTKNKLLEV